MARCYICDNELTEQEIQLNACNFNEGPKLEPCTSCLEIIMDAAYCDGFEPYPDEDVTLTPEHDTISLDNVEG